MVKYNKQHKSGGVMRNKVSSIFRSAIFMILVVFLCANVKAADSQVLIGRNTTVNGGSTYTVFNFNHAQTFTVDRSNFNVISEVDVALDGLAPGDYNLKIYPVGSAAAFGDMTVTNTQTQSGLVWFSFEPRSPFEIPAGRSTSFVMVLTCSNGQSGWAVSTGSNPYAGGSRAQALGDGGKDLTLYANDDFGFKVYGYMEASEENQTSEETSTPPPATLEETSTPIDTSSEQVSSDTSDETASDSVVAKEEVITATDNKAAKTEDNSINPPVVSSIQIETDIYDAPIEDIIVGETGQTMTIQGTATEGKDVLILVGANYSYSTRAKNGKFTIEIPLQDIDAATYEVSGQTYDPSSDKGSKIAKFADLKVIEPSKESTVSRTSNESEATGVWYKIFNDWWVYSLVALIILLAALSYLVYRLAKKRKLSVNKK